MVLATDAALGRQARGAGGRQFGLSDRSAAAQPVAGRELGRQDVRDAGFDSVDVLINVGNLEFKRAIRKFENDGRSGRYCRRFITPATASRSVATTT